MNSVKLKRMFCCFTKIYRIHKDGYIFVLGALALSILSFCFSCFLADIFLLFLLFFLIFFRNPIRITPGGENLVISPADGVLRSITKRLLPTEVLNSAENRIKANQEFYCISIFLSVFNVHVNRIPISGKISKIIYKKGSFRNAMEDNCGDCNESNYIVIDAACMSDDNDNNKSVVCQQIAGLIARRIVCYPKNGENVIAGNEYGIIRFGSRVNLFLPIDKFELAVTPGMFMRGGETIIAKKITENNK